MQPLGLHCAGGRRFGQNARRHRLGLQHPAGNEDYVDEHKQQKTRWLNAFSAAYAVKPKGRLWGF